MVINQQREKDTMTNQEDPKSVPEKDIECERCVVWATRLAMMRHEHRRKTEL